MKLIFDEAKVNTKISNRVRKAQYLLDQQVIKDSNLYCPEDTGDLQDSAIIGQQPGIILWDSVYARRQYYEDNNKSRDKNPRASMKWFEVAKSEKKREWEKLANDEYNK